MSTPPSIPSYPSLREIFILAFQTNSVPEVRRGIELMAQKNKPFDTAWALRFAVKFAAPDVVRFLLDERGAPLEGQLPVWVSFAAARKDQGGEGECKEEDLDMVEKTWGVLLERGWNINSREFRESEMDDGTIALTPRESLLHLILRWPRLVRWCLAHNASVLDPPGLQPFYTSPLLEEAASRASLETFKLLRQHGAKLSRRVLHRAVERVAFASGGEVGESMALVRFLVEEERCDVNSLDVEEGKQYPNHWGTPMAYAAHASRGEAASGREVVRYLLEKGADPTIKDCWNQNNLLDSARKGFAGQGVVEVLEEWKRQETNTIKH